MISKERRRNLIDILRYATKSGDNSILDGYIDTKVREFMYNQGKGKVCTITELVKIRNKVRLYFMWAIQFRNETKDLAPSQGRRVKENRGQMYWMNSTKRERMLVI